MNSSVERRPAGAVYDSVLLASTTMTSVRPPGHGEPVVPGPRPVLNSGDDHSEGGPAPDDGTLPGT